MIYERNVLEISEAEIDDIKLISAGVLLKLNSLIRSHIRQYI